MSDSVRNYVITALIAFAVGALLTGQFSGRQSRSVTITPPVSEFRADRIPIAPVESEIDSGSEVRAVETTAGSSDTVYATRTGKRYHSDGCRFLSKSRIPVTLKEAKNQGLTPCSKCGPPG